MVRTYVYHVMRLIFLCHTMFLLFSFVACVFVLSSFVFSQLRSCTFLESHYIALLEPNLSVCLSSVLFFFLIFPISYFLLFSLSLSTIIDHPPPLHPLFSSPSFLLLFSFPYSVIPLSYPIILLFSFYRVLLVTGKVAYMYVTLLISLQPILPFMSI